jgi:D-alanine--poly(phosphoribitol) ligase subunit 2
MSEHVKIATSEGPEKILQLLASITGRDEVRTNIDLPLYDSHILDSMQTVQLMVALEEEFGVQVSPAEFDRESWATPRKFVADIARRLQE